MWTCARNMECTCKILKEKPIFNYHNKLRKPNALKQLHVFCLILKFHSVFVFILLIAFM